MWSRLGDAEGAFGGTYYRDSGDVDVHFWHMYDQVLLRPELLPFWHDDLEVLSTLGGDSLVLGDDGTPNKTVYSDHLPVLFRLHV